MKKNIIIFFIGCITSIYGMDHTNNNRVNLLKSFIGALFNKDILITDMGEKTCPDYHLIFSSHTDRSFLLRLPAHDARDMFNAIQTLQGIKSQSKPTMTAIKYIIQPSNFFSLLSKTIRNTHASYDLPEDFLLPLSLLRYAYTDEQEILSLAGVIAAILDNPDDEYHAYFKELSHLFLTNNVQRFPDAIKKYPASPERKLRLWTKKEYKKSMLYIANKHLNEMSRVTSSMLTPPPGTTALKTKILEAQVLKAVNVYNIELNVYKLELNAYRYYSEES